MLLEYRYLFVICALGSQISDAFDDHKTPLRSPMAAVNDADAEMQRVREHSWRLAYPVDESEVTLTVSSP